VKGRPSVELAVCTRNREASLRVVLDDLCAQRDPVGPWSVTVVDNGSRPLPRGLAARYASPLGLRVLREPRAGLSRARNLAVREARADWVAFLDDDLRVDPGYAAALSEALADEPAAGWFGGRILPRWEGRRPPWAKDSVRTLGGVLGRFDLGADPRRLGPGDPEPFGANFGLRRDSFERVGEFRPDLGVRGRVAGRGEETDWVRRALEAGLAGVYVGRALVHHRVRPERFRWDRLVRHGIHSGVAHAVLRGGAPRDGSLGEIARQARGVASQFVRGRGDRMRECIVNIGIHIGVRRSVGRGNARRGASVPSREGS
jgi:GT2 family glycosyltransferase